jgi:hypothetical protein
MEFDWWTHVGALQTQTLSGNIAGQFNKQLSEVNLRFLPSWIIQLQDGEFAFVEPYMAGDDFVKYNDNNGQVLDQDPVMQAFSHFSWQHSRGTLLVCDLQVRALVLLMCLFPG